MIEMYNEIAALGGRRLAESLGESPNSEQAR